MITKLIFAILTVALSSVAVLAQPGNNVLAVYYSNPYLAPIISPTFYPTTLGTNRINIVVPATFNLSNVSFPGINITPSNIGNPIRMQMESYSSYFVVTEGEPDLINAKHNYIVGKIENDILTGKITNGCRAVARITTSAARKWLPSYCPVAETPPTIVACAVGVALQNAIVYKTTQEIVKGGCKITVKYVSKELIEISIDTYKELDRSVEEAKFWLGFINSVDGMIWLMNRLR